MPDILWHELKYFSRGDFDAPDELAPQLIRQLEVSRSIAGIPFIITSDYRAGDDKSHGVGCAVDIRVSSGGERMAIVRGLLKAGFRRIGVYDKHVHADIWKDGPTPVMWTGISK